MKNKMSYQTRFQQFKYIIRYRFFDFVTLSLLSSIFAIPFLLFYLYTTGIQWVDNDVFNDLIISLLMIPLIMLFGVGQAGSFYFAKVLAFQEGAVVKNDFFDGIKKNIGSFLRSYFFIGVFYALLKFCFSYFTHIDLLSDDVKIILSVILCIGFAFIVLVSLFVQTQSILYKGSWIQFFSNGLRFAFGTFMKSFSLVIVYLMPFVLIELLVTTGFEYLFILLLALAGLGLISVSFTLYSYTIFDRTINRQYPEIIGKGLEKNEDLSK